MKNKILTIGAGTTILLTSIVLALGIPHAYAQSHGLENAPNAFIGLFNGENFGKMLVQ